MATHISMNWLRTAASAYSHVTTEPDWPKYDVIEINKSYEKRRYHSFTCAAYIFAAKAGDEPVMSNLWKLVKYTQGGNVDGKTLKLCLPIMVRVRQPVGDEEETHFTLMIVLDKEYNTKPAPVPTVEGVTIQHQDEQIFYAKRFGGFAKEADWKRETIQLLDLLKTAPVNPIEVISATYDMPTKLMNRHNEVLIAELMEKPSNEETTIVVA